MRYPVPKPSETALDYAERLIAIDQNVSFAPVIEYFGVSELAAKALWLASENFNAGFSFDQWKARSAYGGRVWVRKKYALSEEDTDTVVAGFEKGDRQALTKVLKFEDLARCRLNDVARKELVNYGLLAHSDD